MSDTRHCRDCSPGHSVVTTYVCAECVEQRVQAKTDLAARARQVVAEGGINGLTLSATMLAAMERAARVIEEQARDPK